MEPVPHGCPLTPGELEVLDLLADGMDYEQAAERRQCAVSTIRTHTNNIRGKLGAHSIAHAVSTMYRKGWYMRGQLPPPPPPPPPVDRLPVLARTYLELFDRFLAGEPKALDAMGILADRMRID